MADNTTTIKITATDQASSVFGKVAGEAGKLGSAVSAAGSSFAALGATAVAGISVISFAHKIQDAINLADSFNKLSQKTGVAVEDLSKLNYAAGLSDVSTEALSIGIKKLNVNISAAGNGSKEQAAVFKALGISVKDAAGNMRSADKVFEDLADRFSQSADGANKTAIAVALLGKNGADLIPLLNGGKGALKDMGEEAKKLGIVMGADFAKNAEEFNDNLHKLQLSGQGLFVTLGSDLVKALGNAGKAAAEAAIEHGKLAGILAGLDVAFHGDKSFKADKDFVGQVDVLFEKENQLLKLRSDGAKVTDARVVGLQAEITGLKGLVAQTQAYRDALSGANKEQDKAKFVPGKDSASVVAAAKAIAVRGSVATESAYDTINKGIQERIALSKAELEAGRALTEQEKFSTKVMADVALAKGKINQAQRDAISLSLDEAAAKDLSLQVARSQIAAAKEAASERQKFRNSEGDAITKSILADLEANNANNKSMREANDALKAEIDTIGLSAEALTAHEAAILSNTIAQKEAVVADLQARDVGQERAAQLQIEIDLLKEKRDLTYQKGARTAEAEQARAALEAWKKTSEEINSTLTDALMRGFESGKDFAKNFRDTIVNMFKTLVLRPIISAVVNPVAQGVNSFLYGSGQTGSSGLLGNSLGAYGANNVGSLSSTVGGWFGGGGGAMAAANAATATGGSLAGAAYTTAAADSALAYGAAGTSAGMTGGAAAASTGATGVLAAIPVWGWIALAAIAIASKAKGETRSGGQYSYDANQGVASLLQGPSGGEISGDVVKQSIAGTAGGINSLLKGLGSTAMLTGFQAGLESSDRGRGGVFSGGTLSTGATFGESGKGNNYEGTLYETTSSQSVDSKTALENFTTDLMQGTIQALQAAGDIPKTVADMIKGVDAEALSKDAATALVASIQKTVTEVSNFRTAVELMPFKELQGLSFDTAAALGKVAGSFEVLGANLSTYYDNFYSDEEKRAKTIANINVATAGSGLDAATATRAQFRALVEAQDLNTEAGRKMYAALLGVNAAFASVTEAATAATTSLTAAASSALEGLSRAVGADKDKLTAAYEMQASDISAQIDKVSSSVGKLQSLSDTLKSTLDGLRIAGSDAAYRSAAQAQIRDALATARSGGGLPLGGQLDSALRTVSQPSEQLFASFRDYARDFYRTANDIAALSDLTGTQLTAEQMTQQLLTAQLETVKTGYDKEIKRLDNILDNAKLQLDRLNGIDTSVQSVAVALAKLNTALTHAGGSPVAASASTAGVATGGVVVGGGASSAQSGEAGFWDDVNLLGTRVKHNIDDPARVAELTALRNYINTTFDGSKESLEKIKTMGGSQARIATASGYYLDDIQKLYAGVGIPAFASGTNYVPRDMLAQIHEGEEIVPRAWNPSAGGYARLEALVEKLTAEVVALRAVADLGNEHAQRTATAVNGRPDQPILVELAS